MFQDSQVAGVCVAWIFCAAVMAFFAFLKPYLYSGGNYLSVASYGSLLAAYTEALIRSRMFAAYTEGFKNLLFVTWLLPYIVFFADAVNAPQLCMRAAKHCFRRGTACKLPGTGDRDATPRRQDSIVDRKENLAENNLRHIKVAFKSEHKRGLYILSTFQSMLSMVREVVHKAGLYAQHVRAKQEKHKYTNKTTTKKYNTNNVTPETRNQAPEAVWDVRTDGTATLAAASELDSQLCAMVEAFANGGSGGDNGDTEEYELDGKDAGAAASAFALFDRDGNGKLDLGEFVLAVRSLDMSASSGAVKEMFRAADMDGDGAIDGQEFLWVLRHRAGRRASNLTGNYRPLYWHHFTDAEKAAKRLSQLAFPFTDFCVRKAESQGKGKPGVVRKSFDQRRMLWGKSVTEQLRRVQEEARRIDGTEDTHHPNMKDIRTWREVLVAMLKPDTDFGWHGNPDDLSDAARTLLIRSQSHGEMHAARGDEEETKMEVQIRDASGSHGSGGGSIEMTRIDNPMLTTPKSSPRRLATPAGTWHKNAAGGGGTARGGTARGGTLLPAVTVTLQSRDADLGVRIRDGGAVAKVRKPNPAQQGGRELTSRVRVGDTLVLVGDQPVTSATTHAEVGAMLRVAAYPLVLTFGRPGEEEDIDKNDDMSRNQSRALLGLSPLSSPLALAAERSGGSGGGGGDGGQQEGSTSSILQHVGKHLQSDPEVVLAAVRRDRGEMFHASEELRGDKAFVLSAIKVSNSSGSDGGGDRGAGGGGGGGGRSDSGGTGDATGSTPSRAAVVFRAADGEEETNV